MEVVRKLGKRYNIELCFLQEKHCPEDIYCFFVGDEEFSCAISSVTFKGKPFSEVAKILCEDMDSLLSEILYKHSQIVDDDVFCEPGNKYYTFHHYLANRSKTYIPFGV
jgi:hypothetical protein